MNEQEAQHNAETVRLTERLRWKVWRLFCKLPNICPAAAHSLIVYGYRDVDPRINWMCRKDCEWNGTCWCGKVTAQFDGSSSNEGGGFVGA